MPFFGFLYVYCVQTNFIETSLSVDDLSSFFETSQAGTATYLVKNVDNRLEFMDARRYLNEHNEKLKEIGSLQVESIFYMAANAKND